MKILSIGDIHELSVWKELVFGDYDKYEKWRSSLDEKFVKHDKIIFIGDYFDSFKVTNAEMKQNVLDILHLKESLGDRVVLLLGNHDIQYIDRKYRCSGIRPEMWHDFNDIMRNQRNLFQAAYQYNNTLWTHAGLTAKTWQICQKHLEESDTEYSDYAEGLNLLYEMNYSPLFNAGFSRGGSSSNPGIFWADKKELLNDPEHINQIVGHTPVKDIETHAISSHRVGASNLVAHIVFIDCIERGTCLPHLMKFNKVEQRPLKKLKYDK